MTIHGIIEHPLYTIEHAVQILRNGGVIAFPTEMTYGIGCDPRHLKAVKRIYRIKSRSEQKPLLLVAATIDQVNRVAKLDRMNTEYAKRYWPGPLTLILPVKRESALVPRVAVKGEVAIRVSSSKVVQAVCRQLGFPIIATSANRSGEPECRSAKTIRRLFGKEIDFIIDGGSLPKRKLSTVAKIHSDGSKDIIRQGAVRI